MSALVCTGNAGWLTASVGGDDGDDCSAREGGGAFEHTDVSSALSGILRDMLSVAWLYWTKEVSEKGCQNAGAKPFACQSATHSLLRDAGLGRSFLLSHLAMIYADLMENIISMRVDSRKF